MPFLIHQDNITNGSTTFTLAKNQYDSLIIRYAGTAQSGKTVTTDDLGTVKMTVSGGQKPGTKIVASVSFLSLFANEYGGFIESTSAVGAAFAFSVIVPFHAVQDSLNVLDTNLANVTFNLVYASDYATNILSGTVTVEAIPKAGVQRYFHQMLEQDVTAGGAGVLPFQINAENILQVYLISPASLISNLQLLKDGKEKVNGTLAVELAYSNWIHLLESTSTFLAVEFAPSGNIAEANGAQVSGNYTFTTNGTLQQFYTSIEYLPQPGK